MLHEEGDNGIAAITRTLCVQSEVRQGGCMSPTLFNMFIKAFIVQLRQLSVGCYIGTEFVGCLFYADDIILLSPSIVGLQRMLDKCSTVASVLSLQFNTSKSLCIVFGKTHNKGHTASDVARWHGYSLVFFSKVFGCTFA